jgi:hypothetical protein
MVSATEPPAQVIEQRVRNRLIEWLEMLVAYEVDPPLFDLNEVLNQWEDWNPRNCTYPAPVYSPNEAEKLSLVSIAWSAFCDATQNPVCSEPGELLKPEWAKLVSTGQAALLELQLRGRLSEDSVENIGTRDA